MKIKKQKNRLDEMQEQKLLKIEHNACYLAFWLLLAALFIQFILYGFEAKERIIGEWAVFMCLAVYIVVDCLRQGIWDRKLSPTPKTNFICSLIAGAAVGIIHFLISYNNYPMSLAGSIAAGLYMFFLVWAVCFAAISLMSLYYRKRISHLENEEEKEAEEETEEKKEAEKETEEKKEAEKETEEKKEAKKKKEAEKEAGDEKK